MSIPAETAKINQKKFSQMDHESFPTEQVIKELTNWKSSELIGIHSNCRLPTKS